MLILNTIQKLNFRIALIVDGKAKTMKQIEAYTVDKFIVADNIEIGFANKIQLLKANVYGVLFIYKRKIIWKSTTYKRYYFPIYPFSPGSIRSKIQ